MDWNRQCRKRDETGHTVFDFSLRLCISQVAMCMKSVLCELAFCEKNSKLTKLLPTCTGMLKTQLVFSSAALIDTLAALYPLGVAVHSCFLAVSNPFQKSFIISDYSHQVGHLKLTPLGYLPYFKMLKFFNTSATFWVFILMIIPGPSWFVRYGMQAQLTSSKLSPIVEPRMGTQARRFRDMT